MDIERINQLWQRVQMLQGTVNDIQKAFEQEFGNDVGHRLKSYFETGVKDTRTSLEIDLLSHYKEHFNIDWGVFEKLEKPKLNGDVVEYVRAIHNLVADKVDELHLQHKVKSAGELFRRGLHPEIAKIEGEAWYHDTYSPYSRGEIKALEWSVMGYVSSLEWLTAFANQRPMDAEPPSEFRFNGFSGFKDLRYEPVPFTLEHRNFPIWKIVAYKNHRITFYFRNPTFLKKTVDLLQGKKPDFIYKKKEIDIKQILKGSPLGKRIVKREVNGNGHTC